MKTLAFATATLGLAFTASPAFAGPAEVPAQTISTAGLDLSSAEGQRLLDQRIERAAREVCNVNYVRTGTRIRSVEARKCIARARASAQRQLADNSENQQRGG